MSASIHHLSITLNNGSVVPLSDYAGRKLMFVNVASECGFTNQYEALQELYDTHDEELVIIAMPCNEFGGQEPGSDAEIETFCKTNYGVTFPVSTKVNVLKDPHPVYAWLTDQKQNGVLDAEVSWNFCKFLLDREGRLQAFHPSSVTPVDAVILEWMGE